MIVYKLRHKPTGLFYKPSTGKGNLSKTGKVYTTKPSLKWAETIRIKMWSVGRRSSVDKIIIDHFGLKLDNGYYSGYVKTSPEDWEIVEF